MGKKTLVIMVVLLIAVTAFVELALPALAEKGQEKAAMPQPDVQYVKVYRRTDTVSTDSIGYAEVELSESDRDLIMDYINFKGRDWTLTEDGYFDGTYGVEINKDQRFRIDASTDGEIELTLLYHCSIEGGDKMYITKFSGKAAASMLYLLQGGNR